MQVESTAIKKTVESVYSPILPSHTYPFVYLAIEMPPEHLDVNVHPTKREVRLMVQATRQSHDRFDENENGVESRIRGRCRKR